MARVGVGARVGVRVGVRVRARVGVRVRVRGRGRPGSAAWPASSRRPCLSGARA